MMEHMAGWGEERDMISRPGEEIRTNDVADELCPGIWGGVLGLV